MGRLNKGDDVAPADDRTQIENNKFRERMTFIPMGPNDHQSQVLYGLDAPTTAWRIGGSKPFHKEMGYWHWDAKAKQVMKSFLIARGMTILAGGTVEPDADHFELAADCRFLHLRGLLKQVLRQRISDCAI